MIKKLISNNLLFNFNWLKLFILVFSYLKPIKTAMDEHRSENIKFDLHRFLYSTIFFFETNFVFKYLQLSLSKNINKGT